jgi:DNA-binding NtrC family response regulator
VLDGYLPKANFSSNLPALLVSNDSKTFESEREILYKVLFDMRQDVTELKKLVHDIMSNQGKPAQGVSYYTADAQLLTPVASEKTKTSPIIDYQDTEEYVEDDSILENVEKTAILNVLKKYRGNRKQTAEELNISVRTLYRKLKEYGLD